MLPLEWLGMSLIIGAALWTRLGLLVKHAVAVFTFMFSDRISAERGTSTVGH